MTDPQEITGSPDTVESLLQSGLQLLRSIEACVKHPLVRVNFGQLVELPDGSLILPSEVAGIRYNAPTPEWPGNVVIERNAPTPGDIRGEIAIVCGPGETPQALMRKLQQIIFPAKSN